MDDVGTDPPCVTNGECFLEWWDEKPVWAQADPPPGWELAWETYILSQSVGMEIAIARAGIISVDEFENLVDQIDFLAREIRRHENDRLKRT